MKLLLEHLAAMQAKAAMYIEPSTYTDREGTSVPTETVNGVALHSTARDTLFIHDLLYMLDGPEQRAAQTEAEAAMKDHDALLGVDDDDAYTFNAEQIEVGAAQKPEAGQPVEPPFGCKPAVEFPDEQHNGVDPAAGKFSDRR